MDVDGVWGQLCFPNYSRFAGHRFFLDVDDRELGLECLKVYNDYLLDEWCATNPARLYGAAILPLYDIDLAIDELRRVAAKGAKAIAFSENPTVLGLPSVHTDHWEPLWSVVDELELPVCMHIGSSSRLVTTSPDAPPTVLVSCNGLNSMMACIDWLMSGILERHPNIKVILSEGGAGWIPYVLERADKAFHDPRIQPNPSIGQTSKGGEIPPSQLFRDHMYVCLVDEHFALRSLGDVPVDNLVFEGDYPHGDGLWPHNHEYLEKALADVPDEDAAQDRRDQPPEAAARMSYDLLDGVRVVELSLYAFAPSAAAVLADWGADVLKVVPPKQADPMMGTPIAGLPEKDVGVAFMWEQLNRGKRCIGIDVSNPDGRAVLHDLVRDADVFLTNLLPGARERFGVDPDDLHAINPRLVYARATAHGALGPERDAGGYDHTDFWARAGLGHEREPGRRRVRAATRTGDG